MKESQVIKEWQEQARAEGLALGFEKGRIQTLRDNIIHALQRRFPTPLPADLVAAMVAATDPEELSRWLDAAWTASSLDDFRAAMRL